MDIKKIDKNFDTSFQCPDDVEWFSVRETPFVTYGMYYSENEGLYRRLPKEIADATNPGVSGLSLHTAGGRVRFESDSPYIVFRAEEPFIAPMSHMTVCGAMGFSLFFDGRFGGTLMPQYGNITAADPALGGNGIITFDGLKGKPCEVDAPYTATLFFPLYAAVKEVYIGLKKGCVLRAPKPYKHEKPVLFYGSSITQGGCACKTGDDYINRLSRTLDMDFINLGFSGSAKAEDTMVDYLCSFDPSVFVMDYDHNAPDAEHLKKTHYALYQAFRKAHPNTPIIMMTMPTVEGYETRDWHKGRYEEIMKSFARAKETGDKNVYLVDCYGCFGEAVNGECGTVDDCHPDSLGFLRMAERVYPVLNKLLNK